MLVDKRQNDIKWELTSIINKECECREICIVESSHYPDIVNDELSLSLGATHYVWRKDGDVD